jgi:hypothetical protein
MRAVMVIERNCACGRPDGLPERTEHECHVSHVNFSVAVWVWICRARQVPCAVNVVLKYVPNEAGVHAHVVVAIYRSERVVFGVRSRVYYSMQ